jgi:RNA polymerase sigma-70 factor (ECF subfamily)
MPAKNDPNPDLVSGPGGAADGRGDRGAAEVRSDVPVDLQSPPARDDAMPVGAGAAESSTGGWDSTAGLPAEAGSADAARTEAAERARVDLALLRRAGSGDGKAFADLVERHGRSMYRLAHLMLGSAADAEDVLQETWTGAYRSLQRFEGRSSVRTWLTRILTTQVALWRRKKRSALRGGVLSLDQSPQIEADGPAMVQPSGSRQADWQSDLDGALRRLTSDHREVIVLREIEGFSYDEIAETLKIPRGTVESRLHRARGELRKLLTDYLTDR